MQTPRQTEGGEEQPPLMPVRRLHNFVYCPRLFYLQWVEGAFVPNEDTVMGSAASSITRRGALCGGMTVSGWLSPMMPFRLQLMGSC